MSQTADSTNRSCNTIALKQLNDGTNELQLSTRLSDLKKLELRLSKLLARRHHVTAGSNVEITCRTRKDDDDDPTAQIHNVV